MIRCVLSYIHYPMALAKYMDFALRRRDDVELFTVGPYTGSWIPWAGGMQLPKYAIPPDLPLPMNGNLPVVPAVWVERQLPWKPDLWLNVDAGWHLFGRPDHGVNVYVGTDPHVLDYSQQRTLADVFFCMQDYYKKPGDEYLPYAFDAVYHAPEEQPQNYDVCLIGLHYPNRDALVSALREHNVNVYYDLGPVFDEARSLYNQAPIGLNWSSLNDLTARVFELLGMKRLAVVNHVPDLVKFFEYEKDLVTFATLEEAIEKVVYYTRHPDEAAKIASRGHETVKPHTWDTRVSQILKVVM